MAQSQLVSGSLWLSLAISSYLWLSLVISGYLWLGYLRLSLLSIRVQLEAGESKLWLFRIFAYLLFFCISLTQVIEELGLRGEVSERQCFDR